MSRYSRRMGHIISDFYALYGFNSRSSAQLMEWFDYVTAASEDFGYPFSEGCCSPGNSKIVQFKNCKRAFMNSRNNIRSVELSSRLDDEPFGEGIIQAILDNEKGSSFLCYHDVLSTNGLPTKILGKICEILNPGYAIYCKFPFVFGPGWYFYGYGTSELDITPGWKLYNERHVDIAVRIAAWRTNFKSNIRNSGKIDVLREIYPINFINKSHLSHEIFPKTTLKDWIEAADHRGTIAKATDELWLWSVPDEDLYQVTVDLAPTGILLCVNKDNPQR
ncbi:MAG: hypothetical protein LBB25_00665, partial [Holosporaceae bacterium]|nr:hypothetical protein [Holosporaceae bacterium]